jgi:hypothetical protein
MVTETTLLRWIIILPALGHVIEHDVGHEEAQRSHETGGVSCEV